MKAAFLLLALAAPAVIAADPVQAPPVELAQLTIRERIVIRVPRLGPPPARPGRVPIPTPVEYREKKGPKCVPAGAMAGAAILAPDAVDLVMQGGQRLRAKLDGDCAPLDFYSGFYIRPAADGQVCARRDAIRVRSGASCRIAQFRTLVPRR